MNHGSLFSGIGGFDLAAEWMGWNNIFHCEWNPFAQKVLKYHFPKSISYEDITKTDFTIHRGNIDIITGGFPCQPYSTAGRRLGKADERHLFPQMLRAIKEIQPRWIIGENVRGLINWNKGMVFHEVYDDLEREGYEVQSFLIPAASVNAPHRRERVWFIAHSNNKGRNTQLDEVQGKDEEISERINSAKPVNTDGNYEIWGRLRPEDERNETDSKITHWEKFTTISAFCDGYDGFPYELDGTSFSNWRKETIKAGGNAIVPQVALQIFKAIESYERINCRTNN